MKNNILSTFIIGVTLLLAGCSSDIPCEPEIAGSGDSVLSIDIAIEESSRAPITSTSFREGDEVFVIVSDTYHPDPLTVTTKASYNGVTWELADKINLAGDISGVEWTHARVEVYYPYNMAANGYNSETRKIEIPNIMTSQNDILYGVGGANKETSNVTVHCRHALTCLTLALKNNSSENATFDTISVRNKGIQGFLGYKGTLDYDGIHVSGYTEWMKTIYGGKIIIPAGETFNLNYLLPPTMEEYDQMMDYVGHGMPKTILEFELNLNGNATYFSIDAAVWRDGCQYTYPVNLFKSSEPEPDEWINVITNGDAEGYDNSCFWTKLYGEELMKSEIKTVDGSRVYAVHAGARVENPWDHQFFITVPEEYPLQTGSDVKISFRYKAAKPSKVSTQIHSTPTNYMHWSAIGDINFTTEWQNFSKTLTPTSEMNTCRTIAFYLSEFEDANDYYFDDIKWCINRTKDDRFEAGDFLENAWDYDNAYVMVPTDGETFTVCVGTAEKAASVVRISSKRGNDNASNSNCIKCAEVVDGEWIDYTTAGAGRE